ncbi:MAG: hypothetical protein JST62_14560 [Bacteroidetes bacterium]|nr:hypothetical protein [Bacteroidota bacterium]
MDDSNVGSSESDIQKHMINLFTFKKRGKTLIKERLLKINFVNEKNVNEKRLKKTKTIYRTKR